MTDHWPIIYAASRSSAATSSLAKSAGALFRHLPRRRRSGAVRVHAERRSFRRRILPTTAVKAKAQVLAKLETGGHEWCPAKWRRPHHRRSAPNWPTGSLDSFRLGWTDPARQEMSPLGGTLYPLAEIGEGASERRTRYFLFQVLGDGIQSPGSIISWRVRITWGFRIGIAPGANPQAWNHDTAALESAIRAMGQL